MKWEQSKFGGNFLTIITKPIFFLSTELVAPSTSMTTTTILFHLLISIDFADMKNSSFSYSRISIEKSIQNSDRKKDVFPYWAYNSTIMDSTTVVSGMSNCWEIPIGKVWPILQKFRSEKKMASILSLKFYNLGLAKNAAPLLFQGWVIVEQSLEACTLEWPHLNSWV